MAATLFIPTKIRVGFQQRQDTYTGKLAYIIYYDEKGKIRKERSWDGWRNEKIEAIEFDNEPRNGFLFNKGIKRDGYHWGSGRSVIRVYDPRDFEFEIDVDNLIGILMHSDVSKRDIVEECVFAWTGGNLVLLPTNSQDYTDSLVYTAKQSLKVSARDLVPGRRYTQKKHGEILQYVGRYEWYEWKQTYPDDDGGTHSVQTLKGKKHIFTELGAPGSPPQFVIPAVSSTLSAAVSDEVADNHAELVDHFFSTLNSQPIDSLTIVPFSKTKVDTDKNYIAFNLTKVEGDLLLNLHMYRQHYNKDIHQLSDYQISLYISKIFKNEDGFTTVSINDRYRYRYRNYSYGYNRDTSDNEILIQDQKSKLKLGIARVVEEKGMNVNNISRYQVLDVLTELGYGDQKAILKNKNTTICNL